MSPDGLVHSAISPTADEADDLVAVDNADLALIPNTGTDASISRI